MHLADKPKFILSKEEIIITKKILSLNFEHDYAPLPAKKVLLWMVWMNKNVWRGLLIS